MGLNKGAIVLDPIQLKNYLCGTELLAQLMLKNGLAT